MPLEQLPGELSGRDLRVVATIAPRARESCTAKVLEGCKIAAEALSEIAECFIPDELESETSELNTYRREVSSTLKMLSESLIVVLECKSRDEESTLKDLLDGVIVELDKLREAGGFSDLCSHVSGEYEDDAEMDVGFDLMIVSTELEVTRNLMLSKTTG